MAIVTQDGKTEVMVPDGDNQLKFQPVMIGSTIQDKTQILEGLRQGQRVFIDLPEDFQNRTNR